MTAADRDLHSGLFGGGAAANPVHILTKILADLHDETGKVTLPGFYDGVDETPANIKASWESLGRTAESFLGEVGLSVRRVKRAVPCWSSPGRGRRRK